MSDRKSLVPELLPDPLVSQANGDAGPRSRVLRQMRRLLSPGAIVATAVAAQSGYGCDPIPPPAACSSVDPVRSLTAAAEVHPASGGDVVQVLVNDDTSVDFDQNVVLQKADRVTGGTLVTQSLVSGSLSLTIEPDPGASELVVHVPVKCAQTGSLQANAVEVVVQLSAGTDGGGALTAFVRGAP